MTLDMRSLIVLTGLVALTLTGAMWLYVAVSPRTDPGFRRWAVGCALITGGLLCVATVGRFPVLVSAVGTNVLTVLGGIEFARGVRAFFGRRSLTGLYRALLVLFIAYTVVFTYAVPRLDQRIIATSLVFAATFLDCAYVAWRYAPVGLRGAAALTATASLALAVAFLGRVAVTARFGVKPDYMQMADTQGWIYLVAVVLAILLVLSFIILNTRKIEEALARSQAELAHLASTDDLLGIANRRRFLADAEAIANGMLGQGKEVALGLIDVDQLKQVNDSCGHPTGDAVLRAITEVMRSTLRSSDVLARIGGDEFAVLLPGASQEQAARLFERLRAAVADAPMPPNAVGMSPTVSIGAVMLSDVSESVQDALARADAALYRAKELGRNHVVSALA